MTQKPLAWLRVEASDEARCDSLTRLNTIDPEWKQAKKAMNDAEEALLQGQGAARERFPHDAYDSETSQSLNGLIASFEENQAKYARIDSRRRSLQDENRKLTEQTLRLLSETREPGIFDAGESLGPNGWKLVKMRDLIGGPDASRDLDGQTWPAATLEASGYHTVGEYLQGRTRLIPKMIDDAEIGAPTIEATDTAVYRFLEKRGLLDKWPDGLDAPSGEQMLLLRGQVGTATDAMLDAAAPEPGKPAKSDKPKKPAKPDNAEPVDEEKALAGWESVDEGTPPPLIGPDLYDIATAGRKGTDFSKAKNAAGKRVSAMMEPWPVIIERHIAENESGPDKDAIERFAKVFGGSPAAMLQRIWYFIFKGQEIPQSPISEGSTELLVDSALAESDDLLRTAIAGGWLSDKDNCEEVLGSFVRLVASLGDDRYERGMKSLEQFSPNLSSAVTIYGSEIRKKILDRQRPGPEPKPAKNPEPAAPAPDAAPPEKPAGKKRGKKAPAGKKQGKKRAPKA